MRTMQLCAMTLLGALALGSAAQADPVMATPPDGPAYAVSDANVGATPIAGESVYQAFHGKEGIDRITASLVQSYKSDPRIKDIFATADDQRLVRLLGEEICYVIGGPCHYTGRDMKTAHANMGVQNADFNALVEDLQKAMDTEQVPFWAQNKLLAKLAPMQRVVVTR